MMLIIEMLNVLPQIDWVIIGAQTNPYREASVDTISLIIKTVKIFNIPIFIKDNVRNYDLIKEFPE